MGGTSALPAAILYQIRSVVWHHCEFKKYRQAKSVVECCVWLFINILSVALIILVHAHHQVCETKRDAHAKKYEREKQILLIAIYFGRARHIVCAASLPAPDGTSASS